MIQAVDYVFKVCAATYGAAWDRSLGSAPIADSKTAWLNALAPFKNSKKRIVWALENLPEHCPNPRVFQALCNAAPAPDVPMLPEPKADPARVAAELEKLGLIKTAEKTSMHGMKDWAYRLKSRDERGEKLSSYQRMCYQTALKETA